MSRTYHDVRYRQPLFSGNPLRSLVSGVLRTTDTLYRWQKRVEERQQLASLDQRLLRDIGLDPLDVAREIGKPFWKE